MEKDYIDRLTAFFENDGLIDNTRMPHINEPFYGLYMERKIQKMGLKTGDRIAVEEFHSEFKKERYEGILINDNFYYIEILTKGKTLWKNQENKKILRTGSILKIEKMKDAPEGFDIKKANPYYRSKEEKKEKEKQLKTYKEKIYPVDDRFIKEFNRVYPDIVFSETVVLCLNVDFYWPYNGTVETAAVKVIRKDGTSITLPKLQLAQVFPNKDWYRTCGCHSEHILLPFASLDELQEIEYISCLWTVTLYDGTRINTLTINYPTFEEGIKDYNIYNVTLENTILREYAKSLQSPSVFSERLMTNFDEVGILISHEENSTNILQVIKFLTDTEGNGVTPKIYDVAMKLAINNTVELFITNETYEPSHFFSDHAYSKKNRLPKIREELIK